MKAIRLLLVSFIVLCISTASVVASKKSASHESDRAKINRAMKAAPISISAHATIMDADGTILRPGSPDSEWVCYPGVPLIEGDKHPMCNDAVWTDWLNALFKGDSPPSRDTIGYSYMLRGDALVFNNSPDPTQGDPDMLDQEGPHLMILYPTYPTRVGFGNLPDHPDAGGPYIMWGGTELEHVMVPLTDRDR